MGIFNRQWNRDQYGNQNQINPYNPRYSIDRQQYFNTQQQQNYNTQQQNSSEQLQEYNE